MLVDLTDPTANPSSVVAGFLREFCRLDEPTDFVGRIIENTPEHRAVMEEAGGSTLGIVGAPGIGLILSIHPHCFDAGAPVGKLSLVNVSGFALRLFFESPAAFIAERTTRRHRLAETFLRGIGK